ATRIVNEVFRAHPMTYDVQIGFSQFANSSLNISVVHWWKENDAKAYLSGLQEMNLEIKRRFDAEKLNFAFPTQTVYLRQDSDLEVRMGGQSARPACWNGA